LAPQLVVLTSSRFFSGAVRALFRSSMALVWGSCCPPTNLLMKHQF
jgi:hypothetical protein